MELAAVLFIPAFAGALSLLPFSRRAAAPITLIGSFLLLLFAIAIADQVSRIGQVEELGDWLVCDGLGALVLLLVSLVATTAALFSWGYIRVRAAHGGRRRTIMPFIIFSSCRWSPYRSSQTSR